MPRVATYRQTSLTGFEEVKDNVAALRILEAEAQQHLTHGPAMVGSDSVVSGGFSSYRGQTGTELRRNGRPPLSPETGNPLSLSGQRAERHSVGHSPEE
jgi:hypothetical protein